VHALQQVRHRHSLRRHLIVARAAAEAPPAADEEMSTEAVAMAYLLKGVHF